MNTTIIIDNTLAIILGIGILALLFICVLAALKYLFSIKKQESNTQPDCSSSNLEPKTKTVTNNEDPFSQFANRQQVIAAISAAIAVYSGKSIEGLRIVSVKKL